ncbi:MAG: Asp-tRNA(Asn)/Glu-tRNA(Gln) amidotransferase subunit GatC, partial [Desulfohalobiaceae bacterium]
MKISRDEVARTAELARLEAGRDKLELFAGQLSSILEYMDTLNELETSQVEPLYSPFSQETPYREDQPSQEFQREQVLGNAPQQDGRFFIVPKI